MFSLTDAARRVVPPRPTKRALTAGFSALGLALGIGVAPSALAQPDPGVPPPPPPVAPGPLAAPPPSNPASAPSPAPVDSMAATESGASESIDPDAPLRPITQPSAPIPTPGGVLGQNPEPFVGTAPFRPPSFNPVDGAVVGVAKPIIINFAVPIADRAMAEQAIHISSTPPVPGRFYWMSDTQVRWRPQDFWPANAIVNIDAAGTKSSFTVGESLVATIDNNTLQMEIMRDGELVKTFPVSMGKKGHDTPNGTYYVLEKFEDIVMDSSTYGVPVNSAEGYKIDVEYAVRIDNTGNFVHSAPWSVGSQGYSNVSHGCINLSPANAKWFYDNFGSGDPIVIKNSSGWYIQNDGAEDWQLF